MVAVHGPRARPLDRHVPGRLALATALVLAAYAGGRHGAPAAAAAPAAARRIDIVQDLPGADDLAAPANGQTLYVLDESNGAVVALDPFETDGRWVALAAAAGGPGVSSIGCIDTGVLAILGRGPDGWSVRTHRMQPGVTADPREPTQTIAVPAADADPRAAGTAAPSGDPCLAVSPSREWLGICGLPAPLPAVLRAPIAGARIGGLSARGCPQPDRDARPVAATISTGDDLILFSAAGRESSLFVSFHMPPDPRRLLYLDTGLTHVRDAAYSRSDGTLWAVGTGTSSTESVEGLWRIDGVLRNARQAARAVCVARLPSARAVVCLSERAIVVTHGDRPRIVSRIDPTQADPVRADPERSAPSKPAAPPPDAGPSPGATP